MAFTDLSQTSNQTNNQSNQQANGRTPRTTIAYGNLYLPLADGNKVKVFGDLTLRFYAENDTDAELIRMLKAGEITMEQVRDALIFDISFARDKDQPVHFAFGPKPQE